MSVAAAPSFLECRAAAFSSLVSSAVMILNSPALLGGGDALATNRAFSILRFPWFRLFGSNQGEWKPLFTGATEEWGH